MAGTKGHSGGKRNGAGRKPGPVETHQFTIKPGDYFAMLVDGQILAVKAREMDRGRVVFTVYRKDKPKGEEIEIGEVRIVR